MLKNVIYSTFSSVIVLNKEELVSYLNTVIKRCQALFLATPLCGYEKKIYFFES